MKEIWKDIQGYEGRYQVSNLGRVRSLDRYSWNGYKYWLQKKRSNIIKDTYGSSHNGF
nr:NUMOD4 domain-containing protein [Lactobacillus amylovorus]